jgi:hypothetical protein
MCNSFVKFNHTDVEKENDNFIVEGPIGMSGINLLGNDYVETQRSTKNEYKSNFNAQNDAECDLSSSQHYCAFDNATAVCEVKMLDEKRYNEQTKEDEIVDCDKMMNENDDEIEQSKPLLEKRMVVRQESEIGDDGKKENDGGNNDVAIEGCSNGVCHCKHEYSPDSYHGIRIRPNSKICCLFNASQSN